MSEHQRERHKLVEVLHAARPLIALYVTGGGVALFTDLLNVAGASRTVLDARVPYSDEALAVALGYQTERAVSAETATALARAAHGLSSRCDFGLGCTATLATDRPKKGEHRAHLAVGDSVALWSWNLVLDKGARTRLEEDRLVADVALNALAECFGVAERLELSLRSGDQLSSSSGPLPG